MPSTNGRNGRGQFAKGNPGGPGNPLARRTARLRSALLRTVTPDDIQRVAKSYLRPDRLSVVLVGNAKAFASQLGAAGFQRSPWSGLETEIDRLFDTALGDFTAGASATRFPVDLYEDKDNTYVRAELPGVVRDDINVVGVPLTAITSPSGRPPWVRVGPFGHPGRGAWHPSRTCRAR